MQAKDSIRIDRKFYSGDPIRTDRSKRTYLIYLIKATKQKLRRRKPAAQFF